MKAGEVARLLQASIAGDAGAELDGVAPLDRATGRDLSFLSNPKYREAARLSGAGAILAASPEGLEGRTILIHANPYAALARALALFHPPKQYRPGAHPSAVIGEGCSIDSSAHIGPGVVIGEGCAVGASSVLGAGVVVGDRCKIGERCHLYPNVVLYDGTELQDGVILHAGCVVGSDGFGYAQEGGRHVKVPQVGRVVIESDVELGANTTVDRGALEETRIGKGTKIDNLVQVGHNVRIGPGCILVAQSGISGSTSLGANVVIAGQSGAVGHIKIGDRAKVGAKSAVTKDVPPDGFVTGHPAQDHRLWLKERAMVGRLEQMASRIKALEEAVAKTARGDKERQS